MASKYAGYCTCGHIDLVHPGYSKKCNYCSCKRFKQRPLHKVKNDNFKGFRGIW